MSFDFAKNAIMYQNYVKRPVFLRMQFLSTSYPLLFKGNQNGLEIYKYYFL